MVLAFFASSDAIISKNLVTRFYREVQIPEARYFYTFQAMMENIHSEVYGLLIDTYICEPTECFALPRRSLCWIEDSSLFAMRLVAFAAVEGIFFSGSFAVIFWLKKWGLMPGLSFSNELIAHNEGMHTLFVVMLYHTLKQPLPAEAILAIIRGVVDIEKDFWDGAFKSACLGLDADSMKKYIEYVADYLLDGLGVPKFYNSVNPFQFMELISLEGKTNFFE
ncbi:ferritin-like protein [Armillaria gallica]|uniref:Ferritin-like protein n=1 Tax=Armillaria gallica TaxID=47427 RepID=A0A2H3CQU1_ARMGA|nr:ferritin-like protein [Armillaria gallica]